MARAFSTLMQYGSLWNYVLCCFSHGMKSVAVQSFYQSIYPAQGHTREIRCVQINSVFSVPASPWGLIFPPIRGDYSPSLSLPIVHLSFYPPPTNVAAIQSFKLLGEQCIRLKLFLCAWLVCQKGLWQFRLFSRFTELWQFALCLQLAPVCEYSQKKIIYDFPSQLNPDILKWQFEDTVCVFAAGHHLNLRLIGQLSPR